MVGVLLQVMVRQEEHDHGLSLATLDAGGLDFFTGEEDTSSNVTLVLVDPEAVF